MQRSLWVTLFLVAAIIIGTGAAKADIENDWNWSGPGLGGSAWSKESDSGLWSMLPLGDGPFAYTYEAVCFDDEGGVGSIDCLNANPCVEAPDGLYVVWKRSPKSITPPVWDNFANNGPTCVYSENPDVLLEEIKETILREFQQSPVIAGYTISQPGPHTLINMHTNFLMHSQTQLFSVTLLGQDVVIRARPTEFIYHFGDGSQLGPTSDPGFRLPQEKMGEKTATSHVYETTGEYNTHATVYFAAEYALNGGPMIPIDGRGIFDTPTETISVWKSESRNVADNCLVNPAGFGC